MADKLPNVLEQPESPVLGKPGIAVKLAKAVIAKGQPAALYGRFMISGPLIDKCAGLAHDWVRIVAIRRDTPGVFSRSAMLARESVAIKPPPPPGTQPTSDTSWEGGWFNVDLRAHLALPVEPGKYWLFVSLADFITERMEFELQ